ncbi:MAG: oxidoreductase [Pseudomonadota bacterium]
MLLDPLTLPCGAVLRNRIAKSAMSDSLGDGTGQPTAAQANLYRIWAEGGAAVSIIGEVQGSPLFAEKPGNLVLQGGDAEAPWEALAEAGRTGGAHLWAQLGHAGAMAHPPISPDPKGPSALDVPGLKCAALSLPDIRALPDAFARTAKLAEARGLGGVQVHAAHGFLLSQFLSPLFNRRGDAYGGSIQNRMRLVLEVVEAVRDAVAPSTPVAVKLNATDQLDGGLTEDDALRVAAELSGRGVDLLDVSGGTYFPGAPSASDAGGKGPYFADFARAARGKIDAPVMLTGGVKTQAQARHVLESGTADMIGLARALILAPDLPQRWEAGEDIEFPRFSTPPPPGGITAWYTMRLTALAEDRAAEDLEPAAALAAYDARDAERAEAWRAAFDLPAPH